MFDDLSDEIRECYERAARCVREATAQTDPTLKQSLLQMGQSWVATARRECASATRFPAVREWRWRMTASLQIDDGLLTSSRSIIAESRCLLATLEHAPLPPTPSQTVDEHAAKVGSVHKQGLSVRIFQKGPVFGWTLTGPANEMLGRGTAETELRARIESFRAGMTYIDRSKARSAPNDTTLH